MVVFFYYIIFIIYNYTTVNLAVTMNLCVCVCVVTGQHVGCGGILGFWVAHNAWISELPQVGSKKLCFASPQFFSAMVLRSAAALHQVISISLH